MEAALDRFSEKLLVAQSQSMHWDDTLAYSKLAEYLVFRIMFWTRHRCFQHVKWLRYFRKPSLWTGKQDV
jgi:hypothetical protein